MQGMTMPTRFRPWPPFRRSRRTARVVAGGRARGAPPWDTSVTSLVLSNFLTIGMALVQRWPIGTVMWIYWCQSVTIGVFMALRMARLRNFSTEGFTSNDKPVPETREGKMSTVKFFLFHYNFFHMAYLAFLIGQAPLDAGELTWMGVCVASFVMNHLFSFRYNVEADLKGRPNIGTMMFLPYARIVPMHLCIGLAGATSIGEAHNDGVLLLFLLLKTGADVLMHVVEHRLYHKNA